MFSPNPIPFSFVFQDTPKKVWEVRHFYSKRASLFDFIKEIPKIYKENMQAERIGSHFLNYGIWQLTSDIICRWQMTSIWVSTQVSLKMQQSGRELKLIGPLCEKWEPIRSACIFSFVYLWDFLYQMKTLMTYP